MCKSACLPEDNPFEWLPADQSTFMKGWHRQRRGIKSKPSEYKHWSPRQRRTFMMGFTHIRRSMRQHPAAIQSSCSKPKCSEKPPKEVEAKPPRQPKKPITHVVVFAPRYMFTDGVSPDVYHADCPQHVKEIRSWLRIECGAERDEISVHKLGKKNKYL